jgi:hypothetical protein
MTLQRLLTALLVAINGDGVHSEMHGLFRPSQRVALLSLEG